MPNTEFQLLNKQTNKPLYGQGTWKVSPKYGIIYASVQSDDLMDSAHNKFRSRALFLSPYYPTVKCVMKVADLRNVGWKQLSWDVSGESINNKHFWEKKKGGGVQKWLQWFFIDGVSLMDWRFCD